MLLMTLTLEGCERRTHQELNINALINSSHDLDTYFGDLFYVRSNFPLYVISHDWLFSGICVQPRWPAAA